VPCDPSLRGWVLPRASDTGLAASIECIAGGDCVYVCACVCVCVFTLRVCYWLSQVSSVDTNLDGRVESVTLRLAVPLYGDERAHRALVLAAVNVTFVVGGELCIEGPPTTRGGV
jgi:hypothetical protein